MTNSNSLTPTVCPSPGVTTYTLTAADAAGCVTATDVVNVTSNGSATMPIINPIAPFCIGSTAPLLPGTSINGITGTWNPSIISNSASGIYVFTPNSGQCATTQTISTTVQACCPPNLITNGSLNSPLGFNTIAPGWTGTNPGINTPDINDATSLCNAGNGFNWIGTPLPSSNGGTWQSLFGPEVIIQNVNTIVGQQYTLCFEYAAQGIVKPLLTYNNPVGIAVIINGSFAYISPLDATPYTWENTCYNFTATTAVTTIQFKSTNEYVGIDGITLTTPPLILTESHVNTTCGNSNGNVNLTVSGGAPPFTYLWSNGATTQDISALAANTYSVTVTDTNSCTKTLSVIITNTNGLALAETHVNATCGNANGSINLSITSASPVFPITYLWSNGATTQDLTNIPANTYNVTVTDGLGCQSLLSVDVSTTPAITLSETHVNATCGNSNGSIDLTVSGGTAPFTYLWSNGATTQDLSALADNTYSVTVTDAGSCTAMLSVTITSTGTATVTPNFNPVAVFCAGSIAPVLPTTSVNGIIGTWSPATVSNTVGATYTFTPNIGQCATTATITTIVNSPVTPTFNPVAAFCAGSTAPVLPTTSVDGINGTWSPSTVSNTIGGTYTFTPNIGQFATAATITSIVNSPVTPTFNPVAAFCAGSIAPVLPTNSLNGIVGTWSPATVSNTVGATYTFTPNIGQCATTATITTIVNSPVTPTFNPIAAFCEGSIAPVLPTNSLNGINGTWSPATVSNTVGATYTFTPNIGQCATTATIPTIVNSPVTPTFNPIAAFCAGSIAPVLPTNSLNGIVGTWLPATVSNAVGATYTFTPNIGQCATTATITTIVNSPVTPTFNPIAAFCEGSIAPVLPTNSLNGINGTWSPATVSNTVGATYTFTPNIGQCATTATIPTIVNSPVTPTFNPIAAFCAGSIAPVLPTNSLNGIVGTWLPATVSNAVGGTYTFTPNIGQCATTATITTIVNSPVTPTFNTIAAFCAGSTAPVLPTTSVDGINGTWSPSTVSNTIGSTYTFTPNIGQCATTATITTIVNSPVTPTFNTIAAFCAGSTAPVLPTNSLNGIIGIWLPTTVSNTVGGTYTFTPNIGQCATTATITTIVNSPVTPTFNPIAAFCAGSVAPVLPTNSLNGIVGTWLPATVSNTTSGTYTFTPNIGQCATAATITSIVNSPVTPTFNPVAAFCAGSIAPVLPTNSLNGIIGTWLPATVSNTTSGTYTFTPNIGQCATAAIYNSIVNPIVQSDFTDLAFCENDPPIVLDTVSPNGISGSWNPANIDFSASGTYVFTPDSNECAQGQSINISIKEANLSSVTWFTSEPFADIATVTILANATGNYLYQLDNGILQTGNVFQNVSSGTHTATIFDVSGCSNAIKVALLIIDYPRFFTPNGDSFNDTWNIADLSNQTSSVISIFDRYGKLLKQICPCGSGWDGTYNGHELPATDYWFLVDYEFNNTQRTFRAHFSLKR